MAPKYELIYFDMRGVAEPIRIMFNVAGVEFTDTRIAFEEWVKIKSDQKRFPIGHLPVLLVDGRLIHQSNAISRFVARELAENDMVLDTLIDIQKKMMPIHGAPKEKQKELVAEFISTTTKPYFTFLESYFKQRSEKAEKMSLADAHMFHTCDLLMNSQIMIPGAFDPYPGLLAFYNAFKERPAVKAYLESRKPTDT